jgi:anti-sigma-K factor RskA
MTCEEINELAGSYALYALGPDEMEQVQQHLAGCARHPEVAEFVAVAAAIALEAPEMDPSPALKTRFMDAIRAEAPQRSAVSPSPGILERIIDWTRARGTVGWALAGCLAVLVAVLVVVNLPGSSSGGQSEVVANLSGDEGVSGQVTYLEDDGIAVITVNGLAPLPAEQTYQVWSIQSGTPTSAGFLTSDGATASSIISLDPSAAETVAVTIEPAGGSLAPTSDPVAAGDL